MPNSDVFLERVNELKNQGLSEAEIAKRFEISTTELRAALAAERQEKGITLVDRVKNMKDIGYSNSDIADVLGMTESAVLSILQGEMPENLAAMQIGQMVRESGLSKEEALELVKEHLKKQQNFTDDMQVFEYWATLAPMKKLEIVRTVLREARQ